MNNNNTNHFRVYDEKLDLLYDARVNSGTEDKGKLNRLLRKSQLFLNIGNIACYRIVPDIK